MKNSYAVNVLRCCKNETMATAKEVARMSSCERVEGADFVAYIFPDGSHLTFTQLPDDPAPWPFPTSPESDSE